MVGEASGSQPKPTRAWGHLLWLLPVAGAAGLFAVFLFYEAQLENRFWPDDAPDDNGPQWILVIAVFIVVGLLALRWKRLPMRRMVGAVLLQVAGAVLLLGAWIVFLAIVGSGGCGRNLSYSWSDPSLYGVLANATTPPDVDLEQNEFSTMVRWRDGPLRLWLHVGQGGFVVLGGNINDLSPGTAQAAVGEMLSGMGASTRFDAFHQQTRVC